MHRPLKFRLTLLFALVAIAMSTAAEAQTQEAVYSGCDTPPQTSSGQVFYVDPAQGSARGDGSRLHPWRTLADIVSSNEISTAPNRWDPVQKRTISANTRARIHPGDTILLMSGDHGSATIQGWFGVTPSLVGYDNNRFITIAAAPGQSPVIRQLNIVGASHFVFRDLTFSSTNDTGAYGTSKANGADYFLVTVRGPHDNIVFDHNRFLSQADTAKWSIADWISKRASGIRDIGGHCVAVTNNSLKNVGFGIGTQRSDRVLILGNTIDYFTDDGIDYGSDDTRIENNVITNCLEDGDGFHRDGLQGQPYNAKTTLHNVSIRGNTVIRVADPNLPFPGSLQGIDCFDGAIDNLVVDHNLIITNAWDGLSYLGVSNATITNNILLKDDGRVLPCYNKDLTACLGETVVVDASPTPMLKISHSKANAPSDGVSVRDNVVPALTVDKSTQRLTLSGNTCLVGANGRCTMGVPVEGQVQWFGKEGTSVGDHNIITSDVPEKVLGALAAIKANFGIKDVALSTPIH